jgi:regulatory protein
MADSFLYKSALNKAMALCAGREICFSDIRKKVVSWGVNGEETDKILSVLASDKFIDEERYTSAFVKDKFRYNKWGKKKIWAALKMKQIPDEIIRTALDSIDDADYLDLLKSILEKHRKSVRAKNNFELKGKLLRHCLAKGFESHLIYDLLNEEE